jgi:hypothetical protein
VFTRRTYTFLAVAEAAVEKFSADFLTERLRGSGVLPRGRVIAVDAGERRSTIVSTIAPLRVEYSSDAPDGAPTRLFLKATPGLQSVGEREVAFYRHAAPLMRGGPIPRCYDAEFIDGNFHLLLEDLSQSHTIITPGRCRRVMRRASASSTRGPGFTRSGGVTRASVVAWAHSSMSQGWQRSRPSFASVTRALPAPSMTGCGRRPAQSTRVCRTRASA